MAVQEVTALKVTCDACGTPQVVSDVSDFSGYIGTVANGSKDVDWVADKAGCIVKAIRTALERESDTPPVPGATLILADDVCPDSGRVLVDEPDVDVVRCPTCGKQVAVTPTGKIRKHTRSAANAA